jgi:hypothetical protein
MTHYAGFILSSIRAALRNRCMADRAEADAITVDNSQTNGSYGVHQARVRLRGDPNTYRLILAPADAPITINGRPIGEHFAMPLGEG